MKRTISVLLVTATFLCLLPTAVFAYDVGTIGEKNTVSCGGWMRSYGYTAAIKEDNSLWMWGDNAMGMLGDGTSEDSRVPKKILNDVVSICCGGSCTAAIKTDGSLWMWGYNSQGQLGNGTTKDSHSPVKVLDDVVSVSCGESHVAAIKTDGSLWTWGFNSSGQLGNDSTWNSYVPLKVLDSVTSVSCGSTCTGAIKTDGSLWMWGRNPYGVLGNGTTEESHVPVKIMDNVASICCGSLHTAAIKTDGSLWLWGWNSSGQLGNGTDEDSYIPIKVLDNVVSVSCGYDITAAIKTDGSLWMWGGSSLYGELGNGTHDSINIPIKILDNIVSAKCGMSHTAVIKTDGSLWMWGSNVDGQLGIGKGVESPIPVRVLDNIKIPSSTKKEYIYNVADPGESVILNIVQLETVMDSTSATNAVHIQTQAMTTEQKNSATGADLATLYAETAVSKAASKEVTGKEIIINKAAVTDLEAVATQTSSAVETALVNGGVTAARLISNTVTLTTDETGEVTIKIDPDILTTKVDKIRVETPTYAITLKVADLEEDLSSGVITITSEDVGSGFAPGNQNKKTTVKVNLPKGKTANPVTLSLPKDGDDTTYQAVVKTDGSATSSKYNPATTTMDGKVNTSGSYTVQTNQKDFTDIANKSAEMQKAIRYLASKGIINGTSATEFSPDGSINRAEIAALLVRALGKLDNGATNNFTDVKSSDWFYSTAGSSQKCGLIKGYTDNTFRGTTPIIKDQILAVAARVLKNEMGYKEPSNPNSYLAKYSDTVTKWAQPEVALATKENLVVYRVDGTFKGESNMTRGDAAIIIYRLFQKIW